MPVVGLSKSECEGFDPEVAECFAPTEPIEFHDSAAKFVTTKPIRPEPPFQWDCVKEDKHAKGHELHVQLKDVLAEADTLRADLRDAGLRVHSLDMNNLQLEKQVRQLSDEKVSLGEQADRLVKEVDMLKGKGLPAHVAGGEGVGLSQTTCSDHVHQSKGVLRHRKDNVPRRNMSSNDDVISSSAHVQRSNSFFSRLSKLFRRSKS